MEPFASYWNLSEFDLEEYIMLDEQSDEPILNRAIFGESLLPIRNQVRTKHGKRADILALDRFGNAVIIELKKDEIRLGVETQALQYLAEFSTYKGERFVSHFSKSYRSGSLEDDIERFTEAGVRIVDINKKSRIILMARNIDPVLFSMGRWLADQNIAFRCIEYTPFEIHGDHYLSFSTVFDQSPAELYPLVFSRESQYFWHNIGKPPKTHEMQLWWDYLIRKNEIATGFGNRIGDEGEQILREYKQGDTIIAYASGYGAVGWGIVENPDSYRLLSPGITGDELNGLMLHRLNVSWQSVAKKLNDAVSAGEIKSLGGHHPIPTKVSIEKPVAKRLIAELDKRFSHSQ